MAIGPRRHTVRAMVQAIAVGTDGSDTDAIMAEVKARAQAKGVAATTLASEGDPADVVVKTT